MYVILFYMASRHSPVVFCRGVLKLRQKGKAESGKG